MISYEVAMGLAFASVFLYAGSMSTSQIVDVQQREVPTKSLRSYTVAHVLRSQANLLDARRPQVNDRGEFELLLRLPGHLEEDVPALIGVKACLAHRITDNDRGSRHLEADALNVEDPDGCSAVEGFNPCVAEVHQFVVFDDSVSLVLTLRVQEFVCLNAAEVAQDAPGDPLHWPVDALAIDRQPIRAVGDDHNESAAGLRNAHHLAGANVFQLAIRQ